MDVREACLRPPSWHTMRKTFTRMCSVDLQLLEEVHVKLLRDAERVAHGRGGQLVWVGILFREHEDTTWLEALPDVIQDGDGVTAVLDRIHHDGGIVPVPCHEARMATCVWV